jgi:HAD superfamily hydrolase (TIGR01549 family)
MKQIKAVMFDLDGTLVYTNWSYRYNVVKQIINDLRGTIKDIHDINRFWFKSGRNDFIITNFNLEPELFWEKYVQYDLPEERIKYTKPFPDVDFIKKLKEQRYKTGIVTGSPRHIASAEIKLLGEDNFDEVVFAHHSNGILPKPNPHGLEKCMELLGVSKEESIYVGNSDEDIFASRNAGVLDVLIMRGEHDFSFVNPSGKINSLYELGFLFDIK